MCIRALRGQEFIGFTRFQVLRGNDIEGCEAKEEFKTIQELLKISRSQEEWAIKNCVLIIANRCCTLPNLESSCGRSLED